MDRAAVSEAKYRDLFGERDPSAPEDDPELMTILRRLIFGDVFHTGDLDDQTRELITVVILTTNQMLPQLRAHTTAALNVDVTPVEVREAVYQCTPFIGFPATLNAMAVINEVFRSRGIELPLPRQATSSEDDRYEKGKAIQRPLASADHPPSGQSGGLALRRPLRRRRASNRLSYGRSPAHSADRSDHRNRSDQRNGARSPRAGPTAGDRSR